MKNNWQGIYGQNSAINILEKIIAGSRIPHALLFSGPGGIGKEITAVRFAQALNAKYLTSGDTENINRKISSFSEPYLKYIIPLPRGKNETESSGPFEKLTAAENETYWNELAKKISNLYYKIQIPRASQIKISSIRDINKFLSYNFSDITFRIVLISDAHLMNEEAQNALLKNLEEPPAGIVFILSTMYPNMLRETIRSRCWQIPFRPLKNEEVSGVLKDHFGMDENTANDVAGFSGGSVSTALKLVEMDFELIRDKTIFILRYSFGRKYHLALNEFESLPDDNYIETIRLLIRMIITWLIDVIHYRMNSGEYFFRKHIDTLEKFNQKFPDIELQGIIFELDRLSSIINNNINLNTLVLKIIFLLASLTSPGLNPDRKPVAR